MIVTTQAQTTWLLRSPVAVDLNCLFKQSVRDGGVGFFANLPCPMASELGK